MKKFTLYDESKTSVASDSTRIVSGKNARIREHMAATCEERRHENCFRFGQVEFKTTDAKQDVWHCLRVSVYDRETDTEMFFVVPVDSVEFIENAMTDK